MTDAAPTIVRDFRSEPFMPGACRTVENSASAAIASQENADAWRKAFGSIDEKSCQSNSENSAPDGFQLIGDDLEWAANTVATKAGNTADIVGLVGEAAWEGAREAGESIVDWVGENPKTALAIGVGIAVIASVITLGAATPAVAACLATLGTVAEVGGVVVAAGLTAKSTYDVTSSGELETLWNQENYSQDEVEAARQGFVDHTKDAAFFDATLGLGLGLRAISSIAKGTEVTGEVAAVTGEATAVTGEVAAATGRVAESLHTGQGVTRGGAATSNLTEGTATGKGLSRAGDTGVVAAAPEVVSTGAWSKVNLASGESISTGNLGPCISVTSESGVMAHLNPAWQGPREVDEFVRFLKQNASKDTNVALIGGMDNKGQTYHQFSTSSDLVSYLKAKLGEAGIGIKFEDLYGMRQRQVVLRSDGTLDVSDGWNPDYHRMFSFNQ